MSGKFSRGLDVVDGSLDVFRANPRLAVLPLCSLLLVGSGFAIAAGVALHYGLVASIFTNDLITYAAIFVGLALTSSLGAFFNVAVAHCAFQYFDGGTPTVQDGLRAAWRSRRAVAMWALTSATLGTVLYILDDKFGFLGSAARLVFDLAWGLLTFFVVPVIVVEDTADLRTILRESGSAFKETWGESVSASLGVSLVVLPGALVGIFLLVAAYLGLHGIVAWIVGGLGLLCVVAAIITAQVLGMVARTALYEYATEDRRVGPFADRNPASVFPES
ncbi:hypothetical protein HZS55_14720 [Halosimplex rubrum]|uniref:Glycerophosphoryl diester phosphodiesterase membrane domain-containing protein n=1 Tax=Halosimplex rubrum TaxID=869889 RepID=A0A7D5P195_9EURY|nr:DUF6159 family protein [Halosimplex rubrum]QLH78466.1 hypothetical protein HZS55_14720 [Halosimplex rubrum]